MGVVYKAQDTKLDRMVALKFLADHLASHDELRQRFIREAKAAAALDHSNICTVHEIGEADGRTFIVMAYLDGPTLEQRIAQGSVSIDEATRLGSQIASGLAAAHAKGVVHRDIKPSNIVITTPDGGQESQAKLMDFGLAQVARETTKLTQEGSTIGTAAYMSPEQAQSAEVDHRSDIWSLGVVLYEMVARSSPFQGDFQQAILYSILNEQPEPLTELRPEVPAELDAIVRKALEKEPGDRYQQVGEMAEALIALKRARDSGAEMPAATASPSGVSKWLLAAALVAVAGLAAWLGSRGSPEPSAQQSWTPIPLTSYPGVEKSPSFSPDGEQVAFEWGGPEGDNVDIYVQLVGSTSPLRLTDDPALDSHPAWSPDGRSIAFLRRTGGTAEEIYLTSPLGGTERKLVDGDFSGNLSWSPDGRLLAARYQEAGAKDRIVLIDDETRETRQLTSPPAGSLGDGSPAISRDGRSVAFFRYTTVATGSVMVVPIEGGEAAAVSENTHIIVGDALNWTRDDRAILVPKQTGLYRVPLRKGESRIVPGLSERVGNPTFSVSSGRLAYSSQSRTGNLIKMTIGDSGAVDVQPIARSTRRETQPTISPDGRRVAFLSQRTGERGLWIADAAGADEAQLASLAGSPSWSPDGRWIAFDDDVEGYAQIFVVSVDGGALRQITSGEFAHTRPSWSHDGRWIYFGSNRTGDRTIWKTPVEAGEPMQLSSEPGSNPLESPDGRRVYFAGSGGSGLWRTPTEGSEAEQVSDTDEGWGYGCWDFAHDGSLYFVGRGYDDSTGPWPIKRLDPETGSETAVAELKSRPASAGCLAVSPDGTWFLAAVQDEREADLMLVEGFE